MHMNGMIRLCSDDLHCIEKAIAFIDKNYQDKINAIQLSVEVSLTQRKLQAGFKLLTQLNVEQYINKVRMEKAMRLLEENNEPLKLVAKHTGFKDASYFGRAFKKFTSMTPEEYRICHLPAFKSIHRPVQAYYDRN